MILQLAKNTKGRDFICPDIHGAFDLLEDKLIELNFDFQNDRMLSLGDLIDRGDYSHKALSFIKKDWFYPILGNHEDMMIKSYYYKYLNDESYRNYYNGWLYNGGGWGDELLDEEDFKEWHDALSSLPLAIEYKYGNKLLVMTHADFPVSITWKKLKKILSSKDHPEKDHFINELLWNRDAATGYEQERFLNNYLNKDRVGSDAKDFSVQDVAFAFCGHTFVSDKTAIFYNRVFLDNGGYSPRKNYGLNIINVDEFMAQN